MLDLVLLGRWLSLVLTWVGAGWCVAYVYRTRNDFPLNYKHAILSPLFTIAAALWGLVAWSTDV